MIGGVLERYIFKTNRTSSTNVYLKLVADFSFHFSPSPAQGEIINKGKSAFHTLKAGKRATDVYENVL